MLDFSHDLNKDIIDTRAVAEQDDHLFGDLHTGTVTVSLDVVGHPLAEDIIVPIEKDGKRCELAFTGARADLYQQTVGAHLAAIEAVGGEPVIDIQVTGSWVKRDWTMRSGKTAQTWRLNVAQWVVNGVVAGHLPA